MNKKKQEKAIENCLITMAESENIGGSDHFFEGVEKLLEIWFKPNPNNKNADLRKIPRLVGQRVGKWVPFFLQLEICAADLINCM